MPPPNAGTSGGFLSDFQVHSAPLVVAYNISKSARVTGVARRRLSHRFIEQQTVRFYEAVKAFSSLFVASFFLAAFVVPLLVYVLQINLYFIVIRSRYVAAFLSKGLCIYMFRLSS